MNWEAIGAIGEIVGAIVVVITLLYLASQTRQKTKATHANATATTAAEMENNLLAIATDAFLAEAYEKAMNRESLSQQQEIRLGFWWASYLRAIHSHFIQDGLGNLSEDNKVAITEIVRGFTEIPFLKKRLATLVDNKVYPEDFANWLTASVLRAARA